MAGDPADVPALVFPVREMMQRVIRLALTVVVTASCGGGDEPSGPAAEPIAQLRGVVHEIPTGPPISGATVGVQGKQALSAPDGSFTFADLVAGETTVRLEKAGYTTQGIQLTLRRGDNFFSLGMPRTASPSGP